MSGDALTASTTACGIIFTGEPCVSDCIPEPFGATLDALPVATQQSKGLPIASLKGLHCAHVVSAKPTAHVSNAEAAITPKSAQKRRARIPPERIAKEEPQSLHAKHSK